MTYLYSNGLDCCGLLEIAGLRGYSDMPTESQLFKDLWVLFRGCDYRFAHVIFSDHIKCARGDALERYIRKYKLGPVLSTKREKNRNSGNLVKAWIWTPDLPAFKEYVKAHGWEEELKKEEEEWTEHLKQNPSRPRWDAPLLMRRVHGW